MVTLHDSEDVAFRVLTIDQVANAGNRHLRHDDFASMLSDLRGEIFDRRNVNRVDEIDWPLAFENAAVDAGLIFLARRNQPVVFRPAPFLCIPSEDVRIKLDGAGGVVRADFKMNYSRHTRFSLSS